MLYQDDPEAAEVRDLVETAAGIRDDDDDGSEHTPRREQRRHDRDEEDAPLPRLEDQPGHNDEEDPAAATREALLDAARAIAEDEAERTVAENTRRTRSQSPARSEGSGAHSATSSAPTEPTRHSKRPRASRQLFTVKRNVSLHLQYLTD